MVDRFSHLNVTIWEESWGASIHSSLPPTISDILFEHMSKYYEKKSTRDSISKQSYYHHNNQ